MLIRQLTVKGFYFASYDYVTILTLVFFYAIMMMTMAWTLLPFIVLFFIIFHILGIHGTKIVFMSL